MPENKELASQMPDGGWAKAAAMMSPEKLAEAKEAVDLWKAQEELKKAGVLPEEEEGEGEGEEDAWETWLDGLITKFGVGMAVLIGVMAVVFMYVMPAMGYGMGTAATAPMGTAATWERQPQGVGQAPDIAGG